MDNNIFFEFLAGLEFSSDFIIITFYSFDPIEGEFKMMVDVRTEMKISVPNKINRKLLNYIIMKSKSNTIQKGFR